MKTKSMYSQFIREEIARTGNIGIDPRHVEAYIRIVHSTLDGLSRKAFQEEVKIGIDCVHADGIENAEKVAQSFGL